MAIVVTCGGCGKAFNVGDDWAGRVGKCPSCGAQISVPASPFQAGQASAPPPPPAPHAVPPVAQQWQAAPPAPRSRPGGLTALAVLKFVFAGLGVFGLMAIFALLSVADQGIRFMTDGQRRLADAPGAGTIYLLLFLGLVSCVLLLVSGIGYIGQKRVLGKCLGNAYGIFGVVNTVLGMALVGAVGFANILGLAYPVITLALLNSVFKDAFPN